MHRNRKVHRNCKARNRRSKGSHVTIAATVATTATITTAGAGAMLKIHVTKHVAPAVTPAVAITVITPGTAPPCRCGSEAAIQRSSSNFNER